jgi:MFS family permease
MSDVTIDRVLRPVRTLLFVNLGISLVLAALTFLLKNSILDYQVAHLPGIGGATPAHVLGARHTLADLLWIRPVSVLIVSIVYVRLAARLRLGRRSTYVRVLVIAIVGCAGLCSLVATAQFPVWMRVGQVAQAVVLVGLLIAAVRPTVRAHFARRPERELVAAEESPAAPQNVTV